MKDLLLAVAIVAIAYLLVAWKDEQVSKSDDNVYCTMVLAFNSNPHLGWPDYKGTAKEICKKPSAELK